MDEENKIISIPGGLLSAINGRRVLIGAVTILVITCIITQMSVQFAGGPRDETIDLSDQIDADLQNPPSFDGLPPFISSGGVFEPEKTIFTIGLTISGILFMIVGIDFGIRTHRLLNICSFGNLRKLCNFASSASALIAGISLAMVAKYPFDEELLLHIFYALTIFYCAFFWVLFSHLARRGIEDDSLTWREYNVASIRKYSLVLVFISLVMTVNAPAIGYIAIGAFFEWMLLFTTMIALLSNVSAYDQGREISFRNHNQ